MFAEEMGAVVRVAEGKVLLLRKNPVGYCLASVLAGMFVGFGVLLSFTLGGQLDGAPYTRLVMGAAFSVALSLVLMAGGELFTGNHLVLSAGLLARRVRLGETLWLWLVCWLGNLAGAALLALLYHGTELGAGAVGAFMAASAAAKMSLPPLALLLRGVLCNTLVCLAVWCGFRCQSESGKLMMVFWCILAFFASGFEHSVANMTLLTAALLRPMGEAVSLVGWGYNLLLASVGNILGGALLVAAPYFLIARRRAEV